MDAADLSAWFARYLEAFGACGRGADDDLRALLAFYAVPLLLTTDDGAVALTTEEAVVDALRRQVDGMRAAAYDRSETLSSDVATINATTALLTAEVARRRADGSEIGRLRMTYVIAAGPAGRRIAVLAVHTP